LSTCVTSITPRLIVGGYINSNHSWQINNIDQNTVMINDNSNVYQLKWKNVHQKPIYQNVFWIGCEYFFEQDILEKYINKGISQDELVWDFFKKEDSLSSLTFKADITINYNLN